jgi:DNA-binding NarL/FixJ family response regulator
VSAPARRVAVFGGERLTGELVAVTLRRHGFFEARWHDHDETPAAVDEAVVAVVVDPGPALLRTVGEGVGRVVAVVSGTAVSAHDEISLLLGGADAVVAGDAAVGEVVERVEVVGAGGAVVPPLRLRALLDHARQHGPRITSRGDLTPRERQILRSIDRGESVKQTARGLGISPKTVENLQSRLFAKLDVRNRAQAVSHAHGLGLLEDTGQIPVVVEVT